MKIKPIILSGGAGKRLWPLSTENKPKQFFDIFNKKINLFEETLNSNVADMTNLGSAEGQVVCAGFFLKNFIDYPWIHIDLAGPTFRNLDSHYLPKGGTGFGVRLLYQFFKNKFAI